MKFCVKKEICGFSLKSTIHRLFYKSKSNGSRVQRTDPLTDVMECFSVKKKERVENEAPIQTLL